MALQGFSHRPVPTLAGRYPSCRSLVSRLQGFLPICELPPGGHSLLELSLVPGDPLQPSNTIDGRATAVPLERRPADAAATVRRARMSRWASQDVRRVESCRLRRDLDGSAACGSR